MLDGRADLAVHSMKDVPMALPEGLSLAVICEREDPLDAFVSNSYANFDALPQGAKVGTSHAARRGQHDARLHLRAQRAALLRKSGKLRRGPPDASPRRPQKGLLNRVAFRRFSGGRST